MTRTRALLAAALAFGLAAAALTGCTTTDPDSPLIAISAPGSGDDAWGVGIAELQKSFQQAGYRVEVRRAGDDIPTQLTQLDELIAKRPDVLVVSPIDGTSLGNRLDKADAAGVPVVAYDRMAFDTSGVDYFVGFDHELAGRQQAWSLLHGFGLTDELGQRVPVAPAGPFTVELLAGDLDDSATEPMFDGALGVLRPYLDAGTLVIPSGITELQFASPTRGEPAGAASRIAGELATGVHLDGILSPDDPMSLAVIAALPAPQPTPGPTASATPGASPSATPASGGDPAVEPASPILVTGCGARPKSIAAITDGRQLSTLGEDPRTLAEAVATIVVAIVEGKESSLDNVAPVDYFGVSVPTRLLAPVPIDASYVGAPVEPGHCIRPGLAR